MNDTTPRPLRATESETLGEGFVGRLCHDHRTFVRQADDGTWTWSTFSGGHTNPGRHPFIHAGDTGYASKDDAYAAATVHHQDHHDGYNHGRVYP